jgi:hypothetical protein
MIVEGFYQSLTNSNRTLVNSETGGNFMQMEPDEALKLFDRLAAQKQWMDHDRRWGGGGRIELDQFSTLSARIDALQKQLWQSRQVKVVEQFQLVSCDLYGYEGHNYHECPLVQLDKGAHQVNSVNNEPLFMTNPPYKPYSKDSLEFQKCAQGQQGSGNYDNYDQNSYKNNQRNH